MPLPDHFQFSQGSLQDFVDCPRRFQLKFIEQLAWPAVELEPALDNENYLQQGATFHRIIQQFFIGVPVEGLQKLADQNLQLATWWGNFIDDIGKQIRPGDENIHPEYALSMPIDDFRLVGKYDLLRQTEDRFIIYDWKTSRKHPKREWIAKNLQTRVYPFLLSMAGHHLNGGKTIAPEQIEMIYWFANFPSAPLRFPYTPAQFDKDMADLNNLIEEIKTLGETQAPLTENTQRCRYCVYRSLCNRGVQAGPMDEFEEDDSGDILDFDLDFEQIAEIEF